MFVKDIFGTLKVAVPTDEKFFLLFVMIERHILGRIHVYLFETIENRALANRIKYLRKDFTFSLKRSNMKRHPHSWVRWVPRWCCDQGRISAMLHDSLVGTINHVQISGRWLFLACGCSSSLLLIALRLELMLFYKKHQISKWKCWISTKQHLIFNLKIIPHIRHQM